MNNFSRNKSGSKYEDQMKLRKTKLEKMRKERELLQSDKTKCEQTVQENLANSRMKREIRTKAATINDVWVDRATVAQWGQTQKQDYKIYEYDDREYPNEDLTPLRLFGSFSSNLPPGILSPGLPKVMDIPPAFTPIDKENPWLPSKEKNKETSANQCEEMMNSKDFQRSLERVSLAVEKVLSNNKNIYVDYIGDAYGYKDLSDINSKESLKLCQQFYNENRAKNRCITCIDWSLHNLEQIAVSYCKNEESNFDAGEDVLIWNRNHKSQSPEHVFQCHSSVMSVCFTKFNPNLILGATYSGQIVLWDNRVKASIPVQCTKPNYMAHTYPVYCLREISGESSHSIMTISTDGKLCSWNLDMLTQPTDVLQLELNGSDKITKPISVTCMDIPINDENSLILGGEDGCAYSAFRYGFASGIDNRYTKHEAPVTSISSHYNQTQTDFGNLFLTSSMDGAIKLWSLEKSNSLHTFKNNYDYVMNVAWSPAHPAVFVAADGSGCLDLYNLNENFEEPIISVNTKDQIGINRLAWNANGQHVAAGTDDGKLYLYKTAEDFAKPANEEWHNFKEVIRAASINYGIEFDA